MENKSIPCGKQFAESRKKKVSEKTIQELQRPHDKLSEYNESQMLPEISLHGLDRFQKCLRNVAAFVDSENIRFVWNS